MRSVHHHGSEALSLQRVDDLVGHAGNLEHRILARLDSVTEPGNAVRQLLVEMAEHGGWELDRVRIQHDGVRRIVVRRKIIRARPTLWAS